MSTPEGPIRNEIRIGATGSTDFIFRSDQLASESLFDFPERIANPSFARFHVGPSGEPRERALRSAEIRRRHRRKQASLKLSGGNVIGTRRMVLVIAAAPECSKKARFCFAILLRAAITGCDTADS